MLSVDQKAFTTEVTEDAEELQKPKVPSVSSVFSVVKLYVVVAASAVAGLLAAFKAIRNKAPRGARLEHSMVPPCSWMMP